MSFLFERYGASVVSNHYFPNAFGNAIVVIRTQKLKLRVVRDKDEVRVDIAPLDEPEEWVDCAFALAAIESVAGNYRFSLDRAITSIARHLDPQFDLLQEAFAPDLYSFTKQKIAEISELERTKAVERFNGMTSTN
jgi:hypothetical protein